jgi:hypothetical protein
MTDQSKYMSPGNVVAKVIYQDEGLHKLRTVASALTIPHVWARVVDQGLAHEDGLIYGSVGGTVMFSEARKRYGANNEHLIVAQERKRGEL